MPATREHELGSADCWCDPHAVLLCPVCEPEPSEGPYETRAEAVASFTADADPDCGRCGGEGMRSRTPELGEAEESSLVVIHDRDA